MRQGVRVGVSPSQHLGWFADDNRRGEERHYHADSLAHGVIGKVGDFRPVVDSVIVGIIIDPVVVETDVDTQLAHQAVYDSTGRIAVVISPLAQKH